MSQSPDLSDPLLRLIPFLAVLALMAAAEVLAPRRRLAVPKTRRWITNFSIIGTGFAAVRALSWLATVLAVPLVALGAARMAELQGWGLLNVLAVPAWIAVPLAVGTLDFAIWLQHVVSHKVPVFWRLHQVHHADRDIDVSTALRFHPLEIALSMLYKVAWVLALGAGPLAVVVFEVVLNACAMFNHANVALSPAVDRALRLVLVTPDMHRVHHSVHRHEHDTNYGFCLSLWDRLFATYRPQPEGGHTGMVIGLKPYQDERPSGLWWCLARPFGARQP
jgi:sterol desaturase/sphingolipid hydroxylase (fatty acid hydroxylase superfamily)